MKTLFIVLVVMFALGILLYLLLPKANVVTGVVSPSINADGIVGDLVVKNLTDSPLNISAINADAFACSIKMLCDTIIASQKINIPYTVAPKSQISIPLSIKWNDRKNNLSFDEKLQAKDTGIGVVITVIHSKGMNNSEFDLPAPNNL